MAATQGQRTEYDLLRRKHIVLRGRIGDMTRVPQPGLFNRIRLHKVKYSCLDGGETI
jgi:hypothetical protein